MNLKMRLAAILSVGLFVGTAQARNLVSNGDFSDWSGASPAGWTHATKQPLKQEKLEGGPAATAARVDITEAAGGSLGEIRQTVKVKPNTKYTASVEVRSSKPDLAMLMVKPRTKNKELGRPHKDGSGNDWRTLTLEFDSGEADNVQILCRYVQKESAVGASVWFTNVKLEGPEGDAAPAAKTAKPAKAPKAAIDPAAVVAPASSDQYVSPEGSGDRSGKDMDNARPGGQLQDAIDAAGAGNTVWIASGTYEGVQLHLSTGGSGLDAMKTLAGKDTGAGLPLFKSNFTKDNPAKTGTKLLSIAPGVSYVAIRDLRADGHSMVIDFDGQNHGVRIANIEVAATRTAFWIDGAATSPENRSSDIELRDCTVKEYTKNAVRILGGCTKVRLVNIHADAGGKEWYTENFPMGFHVQGGDNGILDEEITFTGCVSARNYMDGGEKYWNADGYAGERAVKNLVFENCAAFDNTDGGWDIKSQNVTLRNCISVDNKRNFRFWASASPVVMENCLSAYSLDRGNHNHDCGLWTGAGSELKLIHCTFFGDRRSIQVETDKKDNTRFSTITMDHCLIAPAEGGTAKAVPATTVLNMQATVITGQEGAAEIKLNAPAAEWRGGNDAFDAVTPAGEGYRQTPPK